MDKIEKNRSEHKLLTGVCQGHRSSQTGLLTSFPSPCIYSRIASSSLLTSIIHESSYEKVINGRSGFSTHNLAPHRLPCRLIRGSCRPFPIINRWRGETPIPGELGKPTSMLAPALLLFDLALYGNTLYVLPNCKSLWIKASAKWLNVNVNVTRMALLDGPLNFNCFFGKQLCTNIS